MNKITDKNGNWIDLSELSTTTDGKIYWTKSIGCFVNFFHCGINGTFEILSSDSKTNKCKIKYNNKEFDIKQNAIKNCNLKVITGKQNIKISNFRYKNNTKIDTNYGKIKLLYSYRDKNSLKSYHYECLECGYEGDIRECDIVNGRGCAICGRAKIKRGVNDLKTKSPGIAECCINKEDASNTPYHSARKMDFICPNCGNKTTRRVIDVVKLGYIPCICRDGISYPEKFFYAFLEQFDIDFIYQHTFEFDVSHIYDFVISHNDATIIVETHGRQHYEYNNYFFAKQFKEIESNDKYKEKKAKENGINYYIKLDCRYSNKNYIKNSILTSPLINLLNLDKEIINWELCDEKATKNLIKEVADYYNNNKPIHIKDIAKHFRIHTKTVHSYIRKANEFGWINYEPYYEASNKQKVNQYDLDGNYIKTFDSLTEANKEVHHNCSVNNGGSIVYCLANSQGTAYGYQWRRYDNEPNCHNITPYVNARIKKVNQYDKNEKLIKQFNSVEEAASCIGGRSNSIRTAINSCRPLYGYIWRYCNESD